MTEHSKACCEIPPVDGGWYDAKGEFEDLEDHKTYFVGPKDPTKAIFVIMDIFGHSPQTIRGADVLSESGTDSANKYLVVVPDWFHGSPANPADFPPKTNEQKQALKELFEGPANGEKVLPQIPKMLESVEKKYPSIKEWYGLGYCWGGKMMTNLNGQVDGKFVRTAQVHPAFLDASEGSKLKSPQLTLSSKDENWEDVQKFTDQAPKGSECKLYKDSIHGWMAARSDLNEPDQAETYRQGYEDVLNFFGTGKL